MSTWTLAAVGDVLVDRARPEHALDGVRPLLDAADLVLGNFEGVLTDTHPVAPGMTASTVVATANAAPLSAFDVLSLANNHAMDAGHGGLTDTVATLADRGVKAVGAGPTLTDALRPVVLPVGGTEIAVVACASVLPIGAQAGPAAPGVAPLRSEDCYTAPLPGHICPGVPAKVVSVLDERDWAAVEKAVADARARAGLVVVSVHWGDHTRPWVITDHERLCAELLAGAGADLILGHHHHLWRGVEFIGRTPVFYGLGHIVFDLPRFPDDLRAHGVDPDRTSQADLREAFGEYGFYPRPGSPAFPFHPAARITAVALVHVEDGAIGSCGLVPCLIDGDGTARPVARDAHRWGEVLAYVRKSLRKARLTTEVVDRGETFQGFSVLTVRDEFSRDPQS
ncbi:CapA family protein [Streptomyces sp. NPDC050095]|uniref:CapA family protein n=1 Tax=unclassified Streptomyces TaxID=2593676 RepID=UPI0034175498